MYHIFILINKLMKSLSLYIFGSWAWFVFTIITLGMIVCFPFTRNFESTRNLVKKSCTLIIKLLKLNLIVEGEEHLLDRPTIVVANHASYADPMILAAALPSNFAYVAKKELGHIPFAEYVLSKLGTHLVDRVNPRKGAEDFKKIMASNKLSDSIIFFPEATFLKDEGLLKFKKGAFLTAIKNDVPVIPITISGSREFLRSESWLPKKVTLVISISPPIETKDRNITADEISMQSREMILSKLDEPDLNHKSFKG